uniref:Prefoldin subunit 1 n=1 Tax=Cacopsylla melanoneura TaxID=428564 RepID=A0A8D8UVB9_9HEMI
MSKTVDMELKKAFAELQIKMMDTKQKLKIQDIQVDSFKKNKHHTQLTLSEIKKLPVDTNSYESVGRMFIKTPQPEVVVNLEKKIKAYEDKIKDIETNKNYLERNLKESENNLREMVQQKMATS